MIRKIRRFLVNAGLMKTVQLPGAKVSVDERHISKHVRGFIAANKYERDEFAIVSKTLKADDRVMEVGAGIGYLACYCASVIRDASRLHCFEANPNLIPLIENNRALNGVEFTLHNALIGEGGGTATLYVPEDFWSASLAPREDAEALTVPMADAQETLQALSPTYLIMDIEGGEVDLLPQLDLSSVQQICVEVHPEKTGQGAIDELLARLSEAGFRRSELSRERVLHLHRH